MRAERRPMLPTAVRQASHAHAAQHDARHDAAHMAVAGGGSSRRRLLGGGRIRSPPRRIWVFLARWGRIWGNACWGRARSGEEGVGKGGEENNLLSRKPGWVWLDRIKETESQFLSKFPLRLAGPVFTASSLDLSASSHQYFSLKTNQPPATSQQYFSLTTNQHQPTGC
jgi:hypothetical protein